MFDLTKGQRTNETVTTNVVGEGLAPPASLGLICLLREANSLPYSVCANIVLQILIYRTVWFYETVENNANNLNKPCRDRRSHCGSVTPRL